MSNDPLRDALRRMPREQASPGFTGRVLARLDGPGPRRAAPLRALALAAVVVIAAVAGSLAWRQLTDGAAGGAGRVAAVPDPATTRPAAERPADSRERARAELAALLAEHRRIEEKWQDYRRLAREADPVLYLGGNDNMDLVLDLRRVPPASLAVAAEPATVRTGSPRP